MRMEQTFLQIRWWVVLALILAAFASYSGGPAAAESGQGGGKNACVTILAVEHKDRIFVGAEGPTWRDMGPGRAVSIDPQGTRLAYGFAKDDHGPQELFIHTLANNQRELVYRTAPGERIQETAWSPDGRTLAVLLSDAEFCGQVLLVTPGEKVRLLASARDGAQWWSLAWMAGSRAVSVHDMHSWRVIGLDGRETRATPLTRLLGVNEESLSSTNLIAPSPRSADLFVYTRAVPGTPLFQQLIEEPDNTALFVRDMRLGPERDVRLTAAEVTVIDAAWAPDGNTLYFSGYLDRHAREHNPFRIYRIGRDGRNMTEIGRGEKISVGCEHGAH